MREMLPFPVTCILLAVAIRILNVTYVEVEIASNGSEKATHLHAALSGITASSTPVVPASPTTRLWLGILNRAPARHNRRRRLWRGGGVGQKAWGGVGYDGDLCFEEASVTGLPRAMPSLCESRASCDTGW